MSFSKHFLRSRLGLVEPGTSLGSLWALRDLNQDSGDYVKIRFQRNLSFLINSEFAYLNFAVLADWNVTSM